MGTKDFHITGADKAALVIYVSSLIVRGVLESLPGNVNDIESFAWVTNFAAVGAAWLSMRSRTGDVAHTTERVEEQTNGVMQEKLETAVRNVVKEGMPPRQP